MEKNKLYTNKQAPAVWDFSDATAYLRANYQFLKLNDRGFSYASWADAMGLKSRSFLRLVLVNKRNITEDTAALFSKFLNHDSMEKQYFLALVRLSRSTALSDKEVQTYELSKLKQKFALKNHSLVEIQKADLLEFLISYKMPRLQTLLDINGIQKTEQTLSEIMEIKLPELQNMLQILKKLGLAEQQTNLEWKSKQSQLIAPDALGNVAVQSFHKKSLQDAIQALDLPPETRCFKSLVIALNRDQYQLLCKNISDFLQVTLNQNQSTDARENQKIYQLNLNLIPVTGPILRKNPSSETEASTDINQEVENEKE